MRYFELGSRHAFVEVYRDSTSRDPLTMTNVTIEIVHYDDSLTPAEVVDVPSTAMSGIGAGKFIHFQDIESTTFIRHETYYARVSAIHPVTLHEEISEQVFQVVAANEVGKLEREIWTAGDKRTFSIDYRDQGSRLPLDMGNVTIEIVYYDDSLTPLEHILLAETSMAQIGAGRYVYLYEVPTDVPVNTEFFVRYRGIHPVDLVEEMSEEVFSSFETQVGGTGLQLYPLVPFP